MLSAALAKGLDWLLHVATHARTSLENQPDERGRRGTGTTKWKSCCNGDANIGE